VGDEGAFLAALRSELPADTVVVDRERLESYRYDETEYLRPGVPLAVVLPLETAHVAAIVRLCARYRVPIVPRGAGTGLSGGAIAIEGAITIALTRMDRVLEIDVDNQLAVVQPGLINGDLRRAVAEHGLSYAPDPASFDISTIGGNIAENSGGLSSIKYGVTRDAVRGLEVVLADGRTIRTGGRNAKDVAGYDLTSLFVGSEGTLGVITEATLVLRPAPSARLTLLAFFPTLLDAGHAAARIMRSGVTPVTLELLDRFTLQAVEDETHLGLDRDAGAMLFVESDTGPPAADSELDLIEAACTAAGAKSVVRSADPTEADWLREARRRVHWSLERKGVARTDDVCVPRSAIAAAIEAIAGISARAGLPVGVFGHAGDGNLHPTFIMDRDGPDAEQRINAARAEIYAAVIAMGGTITGEHGTGVTKRGYLEQQRGDAVDVMRAIKAALDPHGLLNPGKVL
jgi:glycolate oxidase